jgi:hypothetical protein
MNLSQLWLIVDESDGIKSPAFNEPAVKAGDRIPGVSL